MSKGSTQTNMIKVIQNALKHGHVIQNSKIPQALSWVISIRAITLYPFIIFKDEADDVTINHERIHIVQQKELFVIPFYVLYVWYWLVNRIKYHDLGPDAYYNLPFEREAYRWDHDFTYLKDRPAHAWKNYFHPRVY